MKNRILVLALTVFFAVNLWGCGQPKAESSKAAIDKAKAMETIEEKTKYLISQAEAFYNSKQFQEAMDTAQYVLRHVDKDSQKAASLLEKAKQDLLSAGRQALDDAKKNFGF